MEKNKILLVDDDADFTEATKLLLESRYYEVTVANDGKEGLKKAHTEEPDLIILDVMMPEMDGYEVCAKLKSDPKYRHIPILLLTAVGEEISTTSYTKEMGMRIEADDYVPKPVEPMEIVDRVEKLVRIYRGEKT
jgi:two-component system alkaline phosphatase synthesis response regulator PhoP